MMCGIVALLIETFVYNIDILVAVAVLVFLHHIHHSLAHRENRGKLLAQILPDRLSG